MIKHNASISKINLMAFLLFVLFLSCSPKTAQNTSSTSDKTNNNNGEAPVEEMVVEMPEIEVTPENNNLPDSLPIYRASTKRYFDLLHTKLDVRFDWANQFVIGKAYLTMSPFGTAQSEVELDAKGFDIKNITLKEGAKLKYEYNGEKIKIQLGRTYKKGEELTLFIDYIAKPAERNAMGGSSAITSDQGLFFINHNKEFPNKPQQIWSQGETESNSRWFPTFDTPNERCTDEITITVDDKFKTLSNGLLISSTKNSDGTRSDYWKMDKPHAPYLFMIAVGDFAVVKDKWRNIELSYFVEPEYEADAKLIFNHTPEMLEYFSTVLGVDYPWQKFAQIIVRDYVSGAMENTTAVIFGEFIQKHARELIDNDNDLIVAHEMFHHWFGDYVTCESWSNLTMNEGFANYSEYLWLEHAKGKDEADYHLLNEWLGYFNASKGHSRHDLIDFTYDDKEDMFDAHSYNKGGSVLHMLRNYLGDEVFFKGLQYYLQKNAYTDVEANELRLAMEDVSGEDLNWFFNQWYFSAGHPVINYTYGYNAENHKATITIEQTQLPEDNTPYIFQLPLDVDIFFNGKTQAERKKIVVTKRNQTFEFDAKEKPSLIMIDPQGMLLAEINDNKTDEEYIFQYENCKNFLARYKAIQALKSSKDPKVKDIVKKALSDNSWSIREEIIDFTNPQDDPQMAETLATMAQRDVHSAVRTAAIKKLAETKDAKYAPIAQQLIEKDPTDKVVEASLLSLIKLDKASALSYAEKMEKQNNKALFSAIASIYSSYPSESRLQFFEKNFSKVDGFEALSLFANYRDMLKKLTNIDVMSKLQNLYNLATNTNESPWKRYAATKVINDMRTYFRTQSKNNSNDQKARDLSTERANVLTTFIEDIKVKETNAQIKTLINAF